MRTALARSAGAPDDGMSKTQASCIFQISRNTINIWLQRRKETGDIRAKTGYQQGYNPKIPDLEKFREFAQINSSKTQKEMAEEWSQSVSGSEALRGAQYAL